MCHQRRSCVMTSQAMRSPLRVGRSVAARLRSRPLSPRFVSSRHMNETLASAAAALRPHAARAATAAWAPVSARWFSLVQDLQDSVAQASNSSNDKLEQLAARVGLDEFAADVLPALKVLAESLQMVSKSSAIQTWTSSDWLLGLTVMAQHRSTQRFKSGRRRPVRLADPAVPVEREELAELLRFVRISDAVYADTVDQFCEEAKLPRETVVRSFDGGILAPKFALLKEHAMKEIVLVVRGTASLLDFCTDVCLMNEPFGDGQGHRGIVHSARWLVKNVRGDLEKLMSENPDYKLMFTGHSLGAGVSALAAMELKPDFPTLRCIAFATPASVTEPIAEACADYVTTVVNGDDCVPRLHQHSMGRLQDEVSQFDWRTTLKQMVDEEIEEHKTHMRKKRDEQLNEIYNAFQSIKKAQEDQAKEKLTQALSTPVGRRVSASFELTKAAFWTDQSAMERLASVKQVVQKRKGLGDDKKLWESVEATVTGLESLAGVITNRHELKALLTKSKMLLATTGAKSDAAVQDSTIETSSTDAIETKNQSKLGDFRSRIKNVIDQATETLHDEVKETIKDVSETVTAGVQIVKGSVDDVIEEKTIKLEDTMTELQSDFVRSAESIVKETEEKLRSIRDEFAVPDKPTENESIVKEIKTTTEETLASEEELLEPLFPPGRILYLGRVSATDPTVELLHVSNDEFSRVKLSNRMILDHLCTTYERELQAVDKQK